MVNYQNLKLVGDVTGPAIVERSMRTKIHSTRFTVVVRDGKEQAMVFPIVVTGFGACTVLDQVRVGRLVLVEGTIRTGRNGSFEVVANKVEFEPLPSIEC